MKLLFAACLMAISFYSRAQPCSKALYFSSGTIMELTVYDGKGIKAGTQLMTISNVKKEGNALTSQVHTVFQDDKGKEVSAANGIYRCAGGILQADIRSAIPSRGWGAG